MPSAFDKAANSSWLAENGLVGVVEFLSLLFAIWPATIIGVSLVVLISRIRNPTAMGAVAAVCHGSFVYLCIDATSWRGETPEGVGYPVLATATFFFLILATALKWTRK